jgi:hypothetical protein
MLQLLLDEAAWPLSFAKIKNIADAKWQEMGASVKCCETKKNYLILNFPC